MVIVVMSNRKLNQLLWSIATLSVAGGLLIGGTLVVLPLNLPEASNPSHGVAAATRPSTSDANLHISLASKSFRPTTSTAAASPTPAPPTAPANDLTAIQLVGTIGDSIAMLRGPDGTTALVEVGDDVNGAAVLAIRPFQIDLKLNGRTTTLVKADGSDDNATDPNAAAWPSQP